MTPLDAARNFARRAHYSAAQAARVAWFTGHYVIGRRAMGPLTKPGDAPYADEFGPLDRDRLSASFRELFRQDWRNIERGVYKMPLEARRLPSPMRLLDQSRDYFADAARVARRKASNGHSEVMKEAPRAEFPRYYLQNFHFQTDGWLSDASADRYDMQVETLFTGAGHAMRRQALPLIRDAIAGRDPGTVSLADLGCGAGAFLESVLDNWPALKAVGIDLSPNYLGRARIALDRFRNVALVQGNAEDTRLGAGAADIVTAVYLFHELPPKARLSVLREAARILKPGGSFVLVDTIQYGDEPGLDILLENFPRGFHEPYYDSFCRASLDDLFAEAGFERAGPPTLAFLTKCVRYVRRGQG